MANNPQKPNPNQTTQRPGQAGATNPQHKPEDKKSKPGQSDSHQRQDQMRDEKR
jgi:hypothetical protein